MTTTIRTNNSNLGTVRGAVIIGNNNNGTFINCTITGNNGDFRCSNCTITGNNHDIIGDNNIITGNNNDVKGNNNTMTGNNNDAKGSNNTVKGSNNNHNNSFAINSYNVSYGFGGSKITSTIHANSIGKIIIDGVEYKYNENNDLVESKPKNKRNNSGGPVVINNGSVIIGNVNYGEDSSDSDSDSSSISGVIVHQPPNKKQKLNPEICSKEEEEKKRMQDKLYGKPVEEQKEKGLVRLPEPIEKEEDDVEGIPEQFVCSQCIERLKKTICLPCGHSFFCVSCARDYGKAKSICPVCSVEIQEIKRQYI
jgi:hypothetical protein